MSVRILTGDCRSVLATLPDASVHCCVTSPPYFGLRDYGVAGQIGLEPTPDAFVAELVAVFREVRRVLRSDGVVFLNLGDSYAGGGGFSASAPSTAISKSGKYGVLGALKAGGIKPKGEIKALDLIGIPWAVAFALRADGWYLRQDIIWSKPNPMPESVRDRCTKAHEYLFLLSKSASYYYDGEAIAEEAIHAGRKINYDGSQKNCSAGDGVNDRRTLIDRPVQVGGTRNRRSVWEVATQPFAEAHFATFPPALIEPCILAGCPEGGTVLDPFGGAGTTGLVADRLKRNAVLIELNPAYADMARKRIEGDAPLFAPVERTPHEALL
jgi:DNA modification methylase